MLKQLEDISARLLLVHPESTCRRTSFTSFLHEQISTITVNNTGQSPMTIPIETLVQQTHRRLEELLAAEHKLDSVEGKLQEAKERATHLWSKCICWEKIYDREVKAIQHAHSEIRRLQAIAQQRTVQHTNQRIKTARAKQKAAALEVDCQEQQRQLQNIAAALFDDKPSPTDQYTTD